MGPTASGKTDLAVELVRRLPYEIVSVDSALVYRGMDIGTSKPPKEVLEAAPHRLVDICDPQEAYSAARFRIDALREIEDIHAAGRVPLLVGGTMLYFRALQQGLSELPSANKEVRRRIDTEAKRLGWPAMHETLAKVDPDAAARIHPNDPQRIQRALEVYELAGVSMTALLQQKRRSQLPFDPIKLMVAPAQRSLLHERIEIRFQRMLQDGFVDEVAHFYNRGDLSVELPSMRAVGYRQVWEYLDGKTDYDEMTHRAIVATRQLAKRQLTWLRAEQGVTCFEGTASNVLDAVLRMLGNYHVA